MAPNPFNKGRVVVCLPQWCILGRFPRVLKIPSLLVRSPVSLSPFSVLILLRTGWVEGLAPFEKALFACIMLWCFMSGGCAVPLCWDIFLLFVGAKALPLCRASFLLLRFNMGQWYIALRILGGARWWRRGNLRWRVEHCLTNRESRLLEEYLWCALPNICLRVWWLIRWLLWIFLSATLRVISLLLLLTLPVPRRIILAWPQGLILVRPSPLTACCLKQGPMRWIPMIALRLPSTSHWYFARLICVVTITLFWFEVDWRASPSCAWPSLCLWSHWGEHPFRLRKRMVEKKKINIVFISRLKI